MQDSPYALQELEENKDEECIADKNHPLLQ